MTPLALLALAASHYVTVAGLGGEPDYEARFLAQALDVSKLVKSANSSAVAVTLTGAAATKAAILRSIEEAAGGDSLVLTLIGHGTFDGTDYKFNLPGPDLTAAELAGLLNRVPAKRQTVIVATSASGASIAQLQRPGRVVVAATRSGYERNATVFGRYWVEALRDPAADNDKNEQVSVLEAYRYADKKTVEYFESQKRLATEHALLEDTGVGEGVRSPSPENRKGLTAAQFPLVRLGAMQRAAATPAKAALLQKKEEIETKIDKLKYQKAAMPAEAYKQSMRELLLELARLQEEIDQ
jgi:hypothetical protein